MEDTEGKDILVILYTWDRYELLKQSLESMFSNPGMNFRLWVVENGSINTNLYGEDSGKKQLNLLINYYKNGKIETLILNQRTMDVHFSINQLMSLAKLTGTVSKVTRPDFVFQSNDDMIFEPKWLSECYQTLMDLEEPEKVTIVSPFHCYHPNGQLADGMQTIKRVTINDRPYEIKNYVSGNTWFMRADLWLDTFGLYPADQPDSGDWQKSFINHNAGNFCAVTLLELAHHSPEATGKGKYNRFGNW